MEIFAVSITMALACAITLITFLIIALSFFAAAKLSKVLLKQNTYLEDVGEVGKARILRIKDTGITINGRFPVVDLDIEITSLTPPVLTSVRAKFSIVALPRVGDNIDIKYDPQDPTKVLVI